MNKAPQQPPAESPKTVGIGCLIVVVMFVVVGSIMHYSDDPVPHQSAPTQTQTFSAPETPLSDRADVQQFASDEGNSIHEINGDLQTMQRLMDPPQFGNDLWFSNVKEKCDDIEIATKQGLQIETPARCRPIQREYDLYLDDVGYYAHWLPKSIEALQRSGKMEAVNTCNQHLERATRELNKANDAAAALNVQLETGE